MHLRILIISIFMQSSIINAVEIGEESKGTCVFEPHNPITYYFLVKYRESDMLVLGHKTGEAREHDFLFSIPHEENSLVGLL